MWLLFLVVPRNRFLELILFPVTEVAGPAVLTYASSDFSMG